MPAQTCLLGGGGRKVHGISGKLSAVSYVLSLPLGAAGSQLRIRESWSEMWKAARPSSFNLTRFKQLSNALFSE